MSDPSLFGFMLLLLKFCGLNMSSKSPEYWYVTGGREGDAAGSSSRYTSSTLSLKSWIELGFVSLVFLGLLFLLSTFESCSLWCLCSSSSQLSKLAIFVPRTLPRYWCGLSTRFSSLFIVYFGLSFGLLRSLLVFVSNCFGACCKWRIVEICEESWQRSCTCAVCTRMMNDVSRSESPRGKVWIRWSCSHCEHTLRVGRSTSTYCSSTLLKLIRLMKAVCLP